MKNNILILFILLSLFSCRVSKNDFQVNGTAVKSNNEKIFLSELTKNVIIDKDSTVINNDGTFSLNGKTDIPKFFIVNTSKNNYLTLIIKPGDNISIDVDIEDLGNYTISGSEDSRIIKELADKINEHILLVDSLGNVYRENINSPNILEIKESLDDEYITIKNSLKNYTYSLIENNLHSLASLMALYAQFTPRENVLDSKKDFKYFEMVDSVLYEKYPTSESVKILHNQVIKLKEQMRIESLIESKIGIGAIAPDISLPDPNGDTIKLSSLRGKYVLLDFWASWCEPCRKENPRLVAAYQKYSHKEFEIYQVSLDKTKDSWEKGIKNDHLTWTHVSDLKYWNSVVIPLYNIKGIPANFLLDKEGVIIAKNLRGEQLEATLAKIIE